MTNVNSAPDWQTNKSVLECNSYMFDHQVACDIEFLVGPEGSTEVIPAHQYVLISRSPVFFAMFCGELAEKGKQIRLEDVEVQAFTELLR